MRCSSTFTAPPNTSPKHSRMLITTSPRTFINLTWAPLGSWTKEFEVSAQARRNQRSVKDQGGQLNAGWAQYQRVGAQCSLCPVVDAAPHNIYNFSATLCGRDTDVYFHFLGSKGTVSKASDTLTLLRPRLRGPMLDKAPQISKIVKTCNTFLITLLITVFQNPKVQHVTCNIIQTCWSQLFHSSQHTFHSSLLCYKSQEARNPWIKAGKSSYKPGILQSRDLNQPILPESPSCREKLSDWHC